MSQNVPVVLCADRHTGTLGSSTRASLGHGVADLPQVGRDLLFLPLTLVVIPFVAPADFHAGVPAAFVLLEFIVGHRSIALIRDSFPIGFRFHGRLLPFSRMLQTADRRPPAAERR